ncbi:MAG: hypothetical protein KatS3mg004_0343 [Bryobacteraceae bacterium]|nr:MAG: hypothetical protein KatS3mg004_0343 [Bryobacteraceae bacterium]
MPHESPRRLEAANTWLLAVALLLAVAGAQMAASVVAAGFAANSLWLLFRTRSARARLQTGIALPLLAITAADNAAAAAYLALAAVIIALQEKGWLNRLASLLTLVFPLLLLHGMTAYFHWIQYRPAWLRPPTL